MNPDGTSPVDPAGDCPDPDAVDRVLDREAPEQTAVALRRHVASCERCRERFGELFEVDSLAPAIAREGATPSLRVAWRRVFFAAAAVIVAAALLLWMRPRTERAREVARFDAHSISTPPAAAPPRLVTSRRVETEIVVDGAGVRASVLGGGDRGSNAFEIEMKRSGTTNCTWSPALSVEKPR